MISKKQKARNEMGVTAKEKLRIYLDNLRKNLPEEKQDLLTISDLSRKLGIPRSTLYLNCRSELEEYKSIIRQSRSSIKKQPLNATRRENKILRNKNEILTSIAHQFFIENEELKLTIKSLKRKNISRIK